MKTHRVDTEDYEMRFLMDAYIILPLSLNSNECLKGRTL